MSVVVTRLFDTYEHAAQAVAELEASGIPHSDISIVASNAEGRAGRAVQPPVVTSSAARVEPDESQAMPGTATGATIGSVIGGGAGLLAGLGLLAIPGVGPVVAAGWLVATAVGAGVGAGAGGLLGSLVGAGVEESDAHVYAEGVRRGGTLVTVRADESQRAVVEQIMARFSGVDADTRGEEYRAGGWERFEEAAPSYAAGASPLIGSEGMVGMAPTTTAAGITPGVVTPGTKTPGS